MKPSTTMKHGPLYIIPVIVWFGLTIFCLIAGEPQVATVCGLMLCATELHALVYKK